MLPDERMVEAAVRSVQEEFDEYGWGPADLFADVMLTEAFAALDRDALIKVGMETLRSTGLELGLFERTEKMARAWGLIP